MCEGIQFDLYCVCVQKRNITLLRDDYYISHYIFFCSMFTIQQNSSLILYTTILVAAVQQAVHGDGAAVGVRQSPLPRAWRPLHHTRSGIWFHMMTISTPALRTASPTRSLCSGSSAASTSPAASSSSSSSCARSPPWPRCRSQQTRAVNEPSLCEVFSLLQFG